MGSWNMFNLIIVSCLMIQASHGLEAGGTDVKTILGDPQSDEYIDQILENLRQMIMDQGLDPMDLPDLETSFSDTILGVTWHGSATLRNGQFWGLGSIARTGDTSFTSVDNVTELTAMLGLNGPKAHYDARAEFMGIGVGASAKINVADIQIYADMTMTIGSELGFQLKDFYISHLGNISVDIDGLGPLDWILEMLVDFIDEFFRDWIKDLVEGLLKDLLQDLLNNFHPDWPFLKF